jgi:hypothetical protein
MMIGLPPPPLLVPHDDLLVVMAAGDQFLPAAHRDD